MERLRWSRSKARRPSVRATRRACQASAEVPERMRRVLQFGHGGLPWNRR